MSERVRIDVWLWRARFFKTRSLAARAVEAGGVRLERGGVSRLVVKAAEAIGAGDRLTIAAPRGLISLAVCALGDRRGPASEARSLYASLDDPAAQSHFSAEADE